MAKKPGDSPARNDNGVLFSQQTFIDHLAQGAKWADAVNAAGVTQHTARRWFTTDEAFKTYYDATFGNVADEARVVMQEASGRAAAVLVELLDATTEKKLTCPHCNKPFEITIEDNLVRKAAADTLLKGGGQLIDRSQRDINLKGRIVHQIELPTHLKIAVSRAERGMQISDQHREELLRLGYPIEDAVKRGKPGEPGGPPLDAEYREVPDD